MNTTDLIQILKRKNYVILDTETTGLRSPAQIIELSVINCYGKAVMDTLLKPTEPISAFITELTGISNEMVQNQPEWPGVKPVFMELIRGKDVITYNATFDRHMLHCTDECWKLDKTEYKENARWNCAMLWYADIWQERTPGHDDPKWQKLSAACEQQRVDVSDLLAHRALADCLMTYRLINTMVKLSNQNGIAESVFIQRDND